MALGLPDDPGRQRKLLIGLVPLLALAGYWFFLHDDRVAELQAMETRLEELEMRNSQARMRAPQGRQLEERLTRFERHIERLEQLVPRDEEVSRLLNQISEQADRIGVNVARFSPASSGVGTHYNRRTFEMTVQGTYHEVARFLTRIGSLPRIVSPTELSLIPYATRPAPGGDEEILEASFLIETYVLQEPAEPTEDGETTGGTDA